MSSAVITARITEFLTASEISGQIGALVAPCAMPTAELPRSPCARPLIQSAYCS